MTPAVRLAALLCAAAAAAAVPAQAPKLELRPGDHVALVGNTLAERMQHDGSFEALLHLRFPGRQLVVRNLGFSGDELDRRIRSARFGTPDEWLAKVKASVVVACFGYGESFAGAAGLPEFRRQLDGYLRHLQEADFGGGKVRVALVGPLAQERLPDPNLPDPAANNARLRLYSDAMKEVAAARGVPFAELLPLTRDSIGVPPLTINGIHLNEAGHRAAAEALAAQLLGPGPAPDAARLARVRGAVNDKSFVWFNRYRTVDGYSVFGERAFLEFVGGQTNYEVAQREMAVLDVMAANRDARIWALANGTDKVVDDSNAPPFVPVATNKPGPLPGGKHVFLDGGAEAISKMTVGKNLKVSLFASEKDFPDLAKPVQMCFDPQGRLWVACMPSYPHWKPNEEMNDKIIVLEDTDGDGKADKCTVFADKLHVPTGLELWNGGCFVGQQPDLMFLKDTDGDGKADVRVRVLHGLDSADTHHALNSFTMGPGGDLYFQEGTFHHTQVETLRGVVRNANAGVYRYEPRTHKFEVYVNYGFANPHGHAFDRWGTDIVTDGTGSQCYFAPAFSGRLDYPQKHPGMKAIYQQRTRPCPGTEILSSTHFPPDWQGDFLVGNVIGQQGILRYKLREDGSGLAGTEAEPILMSSDLNFRPADLEIGPDGALWFIEWQNPIIGHMQHNLRDPSRDRTHGRVYRVTYEGRPLATPAKIAGQPVVELLKLLLDSPEDRVRHRVRIELSARPTKEVVGTALAIAATSLKQDEDGYEHKVLELLWVCQQHNVPEPALLDAALALPDHRARAAAARVLCAWRDLVPGTLDRLLKLAADPHPRVRLEAVRAASYLEVPEAVEVVAIARDYPTDYYLDYCSAETLRQLDRFVKAARAAGRPIAFKTPAGARFELGSLPVADLLARKLDRPVCWEILRRPTLREEQRAPASAALAALDGTTEAQALAGQIAALDQLPNADDGVLFDLTRMLAKRPRAELAAARATLTRTASLGAKPLARQMAYVGIVAADGSAEQAWAMAQKTPDALRDFVAATPALPDPAVRAALHPRLAALLRELPPGFADGNADGPKARFVRIELKGRRTLSLAEVEVHSRGENVARHGTARQKNTASGGRASRAIDGKSDGRYQAGTTTHTEEQTPDPWWEVDLGRECPIDRIAVFNRTDDGLGARLEGFSLRGLDGNRREVFARLDLPAPKPSETYAVGGDSPAAQVRRAAMQALVTVRGLEAQSFAALAEVVRSGRGRHDAVVALGKLPPETWPAEHAAPLLDGILGRVRKLGPAERGDPDVADELQLAEALAAKLPAARAKAVRAELGELGIRTLRVGTVPDQMIFDKDRLVVQVGKPFQIVFENTDLMPHNLVLLQPGSLEQIGLAAEAGAAQPGAVERHYVPVSPKVLAASRLLMPRQSQRLASEAPRQPGVYPYVCTYPGHWRRMYGALYVVADLQEYLASPEGYLAAHPPQILDEPLKSTRPRKEWTLAELAPGLANFESGRNYANGKHLFEKMANCAACHKFNGAGVDFGPDLTKLDAKWGPKDVLTHILEPSLKIDDKYRRILFELESGQTIAGMVLKETAETVQVIEDPLAKAAPRDLRKSEIAARKPSPTSMMPKGLFDRMTQDEIMDVVAYLVAKGDSAHAVFMKGCHDPAKKAK